MKGVIMEELETQVREVTDEEIMAEQREKELKILNIVNMPAPKSKVQEKETIPVLILFVNNHFQSLDEKHLNQYIANAMTTAICGYIEDNQRNKVEKWDKWFVKWCMDNRKVKLVYSSFKLIEDKISSLIVDNLTQLTDKVIEKYPFSVENREIAELLVKGHDDYKIVGDINDGRVQMIRDEAVISYAFVPDYNDKVKEIIEG